MKNQSSIIIGTFLILLGICFFILQFSPDFGAAIDFGELWPIIPLGIGLIFILFGFISNPPLLIPGTILTGIGIILFVSNSFRLWNFWQLWLLVPGFVGLGIILMYARNGGDVRLGIRIGGPLVVLSAVLFGVFALIHLSIFDLLWPLLFIGVGGLWLLRVLWRR